MGEEEKGLTIKTSKDIIDMIRTEKLLDQLLHEAALGEIGQKALEIDAAFKSDAENQDGAMREMADDHWSRLLDDMIGVFDFPFGRVSLKRYKAWLRKENVGASNEKQIREWERGLDEAFPRDAARDRVHEWEGVWLWD